VAIALFAAVFAVYAPALGFRYAQDSYPAIKANPVVERGDLREILTSDYWKDTGSFARTLYRPVTVASFALERGAAGRADPGLSHLINILLHAATAWLLYRLARVYGARTPVAVAAAFLFALHPLALHTVANVVGRADILALLCSLAALLCFARTGGWAGRSSPSLARRRIAVWGTGAFVWLALGSKEIGAAVVLLLIAAELLYREAPADRGDRLRERIVVFGPILVAALVYLHLRTVAIGDFPGWQPLAVEDNVLVGMTGVPKLATTLAMVGRYVLLLCWPATLSPDYSGAMVARESSLFAPLPLLGLVTLSALLLLIARGLHRRDGDDYGERRLTAFAASLALVPYLFVGNVLTLNAAGFAERMVYFPATGFVMLVAIGLCMVAGRFSATGRLVTAGVLLVVLLAYGVQVRRLLPMWRNNKSLFAYIARVAPESLRGSLQLAGRLEADGRREEALEIYRRVEQFAPDYGGAWMAHGVLLARLGDPAGAERALRRSVEIEPAVGEGRFRLGQLLIARGRLPEAEREMRRALLLSPARVEAAIQLGHLLFSQGRYAEAAYFYEGSVALGREELRPRLEAARARSR